jgi:ABC-type enterobactin transport system permease subunit
MIAWIDYIAVGVIGFALGGIVLAILVTREYRKRGPDDDLPQ